MSYENLPKNLTQQAVLTRGGRPDYSKLSTAAFPSPTADEKGAILETSDTGDRFRWTGIVWIPEVKYDMLNLAKGNVPGHSGFAVVMRNDNCSAAAFTDVWGGGGNMVWPTAAESWEIVSSSASDSAAGVGARTVLISSLADDYSIQAPVAVTLNGTTPVAIPGTHFRPNHMSGLSAAFVSTAGSSKTNVGTITVRVAGGGNTRTVILPGISKSEDGHRSIPKGYRGIAMHLLVTWGKNDDGHVYDSILPSYPNAPAISSGSLPLYQNNLDLEYTVKPFAPEGTDLIYKAKASVASAEVVVIQEWILVSNAYIGAY